jgi:glycosyltransferase involved in cell wall biosynthesis
MARKLRVGSDERMTVINYGIPDVAERADPCDADPPTLIMVARFVPQKDQARLLRALAGVNVPFRLRFVGDGPLEASVRADAKRLGLDDKVEFLGLRDDIPSLLAQASIFVLATNWEGLPISIIEANRAGLPVVASDVAGVAEGVVDGMTGFVVPAGDEVALRDRVVTLLLDTELRKKMGDAARRHYEERFTIEEMVNRTEEVYQAVHSSV